jgi:hypothetical protein
MISVAGKARTAFVPIRKNIPDDDDKVEEVVEDRRKERVQRLLLYLLFY